MIHETIQLDPARGDVTLTTYVIGRSDDLSGVRRPAVLVAPGGGYMICAETEGEPAALCFNRLGYHAFVLHYTVGPDPEGGGIWPRPMMDVKAAMETIAANADAWGVDAEQIALCGFSAGAHNCGLYGASWKSLAMPRPAAVILGYPLGDIRENLRADAIPSEVAGAEHFCKVLTGAAKPDDQTLDALSVQKNIGADMPPTFLWNTSEDEMVLPTQCLSIAAALAAHRVHYELHTFERGPHALSTADESSAARRSRCFPDVAVWTELAAVWLKKHLAIGLPGRAR